MRMTKGTWVLVLDGSKALILENTTDGFDPALRVVRKDANEEPTDRRGQATDKPRREEAAPGEREGPEPAEFHRLEEPRFADDMAERLYLDAHRGRFDKLVLVAGPQVLGQLRPKLHQEVTSRVVAEVPKNLTGHPVAEIERILTAELDAL